MSPAGLDAEQRRAWTAAQELWGVRLHDARLEPDAHQGSFAWFSFPPSITIDPMLAQSTGADRELVSVFAHEIGHHVLSPSTRRASLAITQQIARALIASSVAPVSELSSKAAYAANLWSDLLINTKVVDLQRRSDPHTDPGMIRLWRILAIEQPDPLFWVYLRASEDLWGLPDGSICPATPPAVPAGRQPEQDAPIASAQPALDASLLAETARTFADDPIRGALRFGMIAAPYLLAGHDAAPGCGGDVTAGQPTAAELADVLRDPRLTEEPVHPAVASPGDPMPANGAAPAGSQGYGLSETLKLYESVPEQTVLTAWYLERTRPFVRPYRQPNVAAERSELPGASELWEIGDDLSDIDWPATLVASPQMIPGITTRRRGVLIDEAPRRDVPVELDLYVDSSGSMPQPQQDSPTLLAGAILISSVLAGGGRVRVTSFSGPGQVAGTLRMTANRVEAIAALLEYFGGGTTFPLDLLGQRYRDRPSGVRRHLVVLSDEGLGSFFGVGQSGFDRVAVDVRAVVDTATLVLCDPRRSTADLAAAAGYDVEYLESVDDAPAACAALARRIATLADVRRG